MSVEKQRLITEILAEAAAAGLGYYSQIWLVVLVVQARQGLGEISRCLSGTELAQTELVQTELVWTELVWTELVRTELVRTQLVETGLVQTELITELVAELEAQVEIRQLKELKVFDTLRLFVEVFAEILAAEVLVKLAGGTELVQTELVQTELVQTELVQTELVQTELVQTELVQAELVQTELVRTELVQTELVAVYCWDSLESYTSLQRVFGA